MKKRLMMVLGVLGMVSCQMKNEPVNGSSKSEMANNDYEITISCKRGNDVAQLWEFSVKNNQLSYTLRESAGVVELTHDEAGEIENMLLSNKAHKIKTKAVARNQKNEWLSVVILQRDYQVRCAESLNYKLTKKSRKRISSIYTQLVRLVKSKGNVKSNELASRLN